MANVSGVWQFKYIDINEGIPHQVTFCSVAKTSWVKTFDF